MKIRTVAVMLAMIAVGCDDDTDPATTDAELRRDARIESDGNVDDLGAELGDAEVPQPLFCDGALISDDAPITRSWGCGCFEGELPPPAMSCKNPTHSDCPGTLLVDEGASGCREDCLDPGTGDTLWSVSYSGNHTRWFIRGGNAGDCVNGWALFTWERGDDVRFDPRPFANNADGRCVCWGAQADCPDGCVPATRPACRASEYACEERGEGDECGIARGEFPCHDGPGCTIGRCRETDALRCCI